MDKKVLRQIDLKVRWLIDRMKAPAAERHIQIVKWERQLERIRLSSSASRANKSGSPQLLEDQQSPVQNSHQSLPGQ